MSFYVEMVLPKRDLKIDLRFVYILSIDFGKWPKFNTP
jgi:hypothetical protein